MPSTTVDYLEAQTLRAWRPENGAHLRLELRDRQTVLSVRIKRLFPLSDGGHYLSIQDGANHEVGILRSMEGLDSESRKLFDEELDRRYFSPMIRRIDVLRTEAGMWRFLVQTQRGPSEFYVRNWRDSAHEIGIGRWMISSVDGQRFEIKQVNDLDAKSRQLLEQVF